MGVARHGLSYTSEYRAWQTMRLRCTVPENPAYDDYGGRGITVCARWLASVVDFVEDMGPKPTPKHEIDRRDNDGGYWCGKCLECVTRGQPANCRWATRSENDRNRRNNIHLEFRGETKTQAEWCELYGVPGDTLRFRIRKGWSLDRALTTPVRTKAPNGTAAKRCSICKDRGRYGVRISVPPGWRWEVCDCPAGKVAAA